MKMIIQRENESNCSFLFSLFPKVEKGREEKEKRKRRKREEKEKEKKKRKMKG